MRTIIYFLLLTSLAVLFTPFVSSAQAGKPDSVVVITDTAKLTTDQLIAIGKGNARGNIYTKVEIESEFPGGNKAWLNFLNQHLTYPKKAVRKRIQGTVLLQFIVDVEGSISGIYVLKGDPLLGEAAVKAMEASPRWKPAMQNGRLVKSFKKQSIVFRLEYGQ